MKNCQDPLQVYQATQTGAAVLVDVRSANDWSSGIPRGAKCLSKEQLLAESDDLADTYEHIYIICYRGQSSLSVATELNETVAGKFVSVTGGYQAWTAMGLPTEQPVLDEQLWRYDRQVKLNGFGPEAQEKLKQSHILVVGAGGLGSPALLYLAGCGVGTLTLVDHDTVALHNLHRQILYTEADVGSSKVVAAEKRLKELNSTIKINVVDEFLNAENATALMSEADLILDGSDNISTRYLINDISLKLNKPWVFAAVSAFDVQLTFFSGNKNEPCYRCLFPDLGAEAIGNCAQEGILGSVPGVAALIQTTEAIKYLTGMGQLLQQHMLSYDLLNHQFKVLKYPANKCESCEH